MAVSDFNAFPLPEAYSAVDFSPLAHLGQYQQDQQRQQRLADLARSSDVPPLPASLPGGAPAGYTSSSGTSAPFYAPQTSADVDNAIRATAARAGMDPASWKAIAHIESSLNPNSNYNEPTQYKGLFQTGTYEFAAHGKGNTYNAMDNARAAASLAAANNATFKAAFGRDPTPAETYLMHQQGAGFYTKGSMRNIAGNLPPEARTPENMTHEGFERYWTNQIERRRKYFERQNQQVESRPLAEAAPNSANPNLYANP